MQTCWEQLDHFPEVGRLLKRKYTKAVKASLENKPTFAATELATKDSKSSTPRPKWIAAVSTELRRLGRDRLVYLEHSPSFCDANVLTSGMQGRRCRDQAHCEQVCCGRGHRSFAESVTETCQCRVVWCCQLQCKTCSFVRLAHECL